MLALLKYVFLNELSINRLHSALISFHEHFPLKWFANLLESVEITIWRSSRRLRKEGWGRNKGRSLDPFKGLIQLGVGTDFHLSLTLSIIQMKKKIRFKRTNIFPRCISSVVCPPFVKKVTLNKIKTENCRLALKDSEFKFSQFEDLWI